MAISSSSIGWMRPTSRDYLVLFHGLEGCSRSNYAVSLMNQVAARGLAGSGAALSRLRR